MVEVQFGVEGGMTRTFRWILAAWLAAAGWPALAEFLPPERAFALEARQQGGEVLLSWTIAEGYYLYRDKVQVRPLSGNEAALAPLPPGERHADEYFGATEVYRGTAQATVRATPGAIEVGWQGCADAGLCYPPQARRIDVVPVAAGAGIEPAAGPAPLAEDESLAARLSRASPVWVALTFFGLGLLMTFTPCVLPMVPIVSGIVVGAGRGPRRGLALSLAYVLPMAATYAALGAAAAVAGLNLQAAFQNPWVLGGFALVFVALAAAMFGAYELQMPAALRERLERAGMGRRGGSLRGAAALGALSAVLVGPCMTAPLAGALLFIGRTGDVATGALAMFALGLGMGAPLVLVGTLGARLLPRPGPWMERVKSFFGFVLLGTAIAFVSRVVPPAVTLALWGVLALALAVRLAWGARGARPGRRAAFAAASLPFAAWGLALFVGAANGAHDPLRPLAFQAHGAAPSFQAVATLDALDRRLAQASARGEWTLVDVYADWCVSCQVIEREVFPEPRVARALSGMQRLRVDVTKNDAQDRAFLDRYGILGPPTLLLIGPDGRERRSERVVGELDAEAFLARIARAQAGG